ncbi:hypothetical protein R6242_12895 [Iodobacter sp. CM08]|uniref:hypothetical protein n=1 Tax=Iodobacter sp. CM08 TaxID=3085902 RepID=UPI0029827A18|nr:hypothetical protein [Iodobacter sp. CM08]MDW5417464.1 hypothetical protein [Iodobacter sp. CM08]
MAATAEQLAQPFTPRVINTLEPKRCNAKKIHVEGREMVLAMVSCYPAMPKGDSPKERPAFSYADDGEEVLASIKPQAARPLPRLNAEEEAELLNHLAWLRELDTAIRGRITRLSQYELPLDASVLPQVRSLLGGLIAEGDVAQQNAWYAKAVMK